MLSIKKNVRAILSDAASDLAATLMLYATVKDKPKLYELANYKNAALRRFNEAQFISVTKVINELAIENLPELAPYGIDAASLIIYSQKIETFVVAKTQPRDEIYNKKEATATIKETFKTMDLLLKNMDKAVRTLLRSQTIFNNRYFARRKLIDPPTKMLALRAQAIDQDGNPIPFVKITCLKLKLNRKTSINGRFSIRIAPPGKYKITCHRPGFQPLTKYITIADGVRTELKIELLPIHSENSLVRIIE